MSILVINSYLKELSFGIMQVVYNPQFNEHAGLHYLFHVKRIIDYKLNSYHFIFYNLPNILGGSFFSMTSSKHT